MLFVVVVVCRPVVFSSRFWMHPPACSFSELLVLSSIFSQEQCQKKKKKELFLLELDEAQ
jgi:hypothetical protein